MEKIILKNYYKRLLLIPGLLKRGFVLGDEFRKKYDVHPTPIINFQSFDVECDSVKFRFISKSNMPLQYTIKEVIAEKCYLKYLQSDCNNTVIVDIGANVGIFSIFMAKRYNCYVYAVEMDKKNYDFCMLNIDENKVSDKIKLFNLAITDRSGSVYYDSSYDLVGSKVINQKNSEIIHNHSMADSLTLNDFMKQENLNKIDILKLDCEGSEFEILKSADTNIFQRINNLVMEYHLSYKNQMSDLKKIISKLRPHYKNIIVERDLISDNIGFIYCIN